MLNWIEELKKLGELHQEGILSAEEFQAAKKKLLSQKDDPPAAGTDGGKDHSSPSSSSSGIKNSLDADSTNPVPYQQSVRVPTRNSSVSGKENSDFSQGDVTGDDSFEGVSEDDFPMEDDTPLESLGSYDILGLLGRGT